MAIGIIGIGIGISLHGSSIDKPPFIGRLVMNCVLIVFELFCCMIYLSQCFALTVTNPSWCFGVFNCQALNLGYLLLKNFKLTILRRGMFAGLDALCE